MFVAIMYVFVWHEPKVALYAGCAAIPWALIALNGYFDARREKP